MSANFELQYKHMEWNYDNGLYDDVILSSGNHSIMTKPGDEPGSIDIEVFSDDKDTLNEMIYLIQKEFKDITIVEDYDFDDIFCKKWVTVVNKPKAVRRYAGYYCVKENIEDRLYDLFYSFIYRLVNHI